MKPELKRRIAELQGFQNPKASLEQYITPPELVSDLVYTAYMQGDLEGKKVVDLGTGTGSFAIAAALLGAEVTAVEKDPKALETLRENIKTAGVEIEVIEQDIRDLNREFDTVFMNPPFSVHTELGEEFVRKALEIGDVIYAVLNPKLKERLKEFSDLHELKEAETYEISLPPTLAFHTEERHIIEVEAVHVRKQ
ncbi:METTL5 family protein [Candidatus Nanohalococcus occultus]|uniref:RNA methylase n=1 Tax=Candidatus Nanohalococcus occultus TaxID=2978047 RepID=A0ABY8CKD1_9ARCH|nr:Putative RNA methylase [Candidatus Nanohaloarchaeota archaeon SVXNc]